jgi:hypothetical protein
MRAIKGSGGIKTLIAKALDCHICTVHILLNKPGWDDVREALQQEIESVADLAEKNIRSALLQRFGPDHAMQTSKWLLTRPRYARRGMMDANRIAIEGGDSPIQVQTTNVPIEALNLPVEVRRQILKAIEEKEKQDVKV